MSAGTEARPARVPGAHYGWVIVAISFLATALVLGSRFTLGLFLPYMPDALDASPDAVSGAFAISMLGAALVQPFAGLAIDRLGGKTVLSLGLLAAGLALCGTAMASALWQVIVFMGLASSIAYAAASPVSTTSIVSSWFEANRGAALGVATSGTKVAMVVLPPILAALIVLFGWRATMLTLGLSIWLLIPVVLVFMKTAPGSAADLRAKSRRAARAGTPDDVAPAQAEVPDGTTLIGALRAPAFWLIGIALFANGLIMNLVFIHLPNFVLEAGYGEGIAATGLAALGGIGILGTMVTGALSDRVGRRNVLLIMFGARGITAMAVVLLPGPVSLAAFVLVFGLLGYGAIGVIGAMAAELFGKRALGTILGSVYVFNQAGGAAGVYAGGLSLSLTGDYGAALWLAVATTLLSLLCIVALRDAPRRA